MSEMTADKLVTIYQKMGVKLTELERQQDEIKAQRKRSEEHTSELQSH